MAPLPTGEVGREPGFDLFRLAAWPREEKAVEVEGNEGKHLRATLFHQPALLLEGLVDFVIDPPARQGGLRATEQHLVPEPDAAVDLLIDVVTWTHLVLVEPAANAAPLELVVQTAGERLVRMVVADKTGVEFEG